MNEKSIEDEIRQWVQCGMQICTYQREIKTAEDGIVAQSADKRSLEDSILRRVPDGENHYIFGETLVCIANGVINFKSATRIPDPRFRS
jgi:hypothetical protein